MAETTIQPEPGHWTTVDPDRTGMFASARRATRETMNLASNLTVVATGHQAAIWHPGILAKDLAITALAAHGTASGRAMQAIHFIADHDANDGGLIPYPGPGPSRASWRMLPVSEGTATRDLPAAPPSSPPTDAIGIAAVSEGMAAIHAAVSAHADAANLALQLGLATDTLASPFTGGVPRRSMSRLLEAPIGLELVDRMLQDPEACITAHDEAVEADRRTRADGSGRWPRGAARPLRRGSTEELPLWRATEHGRRPVLRGERIDPASCRPRALLATALARLGGCDLFVHGLGGSHYDPTMEDWIGRWLGPEVAAELAPVTMATATLRLPIEVESPPETPPATPEGLHRLLSDPDLDRNAAPRREQLLASIEVAARRSLDRRSAFDALRREIDLARTRGRDTIDRYRGRLAAEGERRRGLEIASDRTWAFPMHRSEDLRSLAAKIDRSFSGRSA